MNTALMHEFRPPWWLRGGHRQTVISTFWGHGSLKLASKQKQIPLSDGDSMVIHIELPTRVSQRDVRDQATPVVVLIHGLGGSHASPYMIRIANQCRDKGFVAVRVDLRGCGAGTAIACGPAHAGCSPDLAAVVEHLCQEFPNSQLLIAGFSMGGNVLLKMLAEAAEGAYADRFSLDRIDRCVAIAPPIDLEYCSNKMEKGLRRLYAAYFLRSLRRQVFARQEKWPQWAAIPWAPAPKTIREFDNRYTAPMGGFKDASDYYYQSSSIHRLPQLRTPTTILAAKDDPIVPVEIFRDVKLSSTTQQFISPHGGHVGFFGPSHSSQSQYRWLDDWLLNQLLSQ